LICFYDFPNISWFEAEKIYLKTWSQHIKLLLNTRLTGVILSYLSAKLYLGMIVLLFRRIVIILLEGEVLSGDRLLAVFPSRS
jgi:hypothetical protein